MILHLKEIGASQLVSIIIFKHNYSAIFLGHLDVTLHIHTKNPLGAYRKLKKTLSKKTKHDHEQEDISRPYLYTIFFFFGLFDDVRIFYLSLLGTIKSIDCLFFNFYFFLY